MKKKVTIYLVTLTYGDESREWEGDKSCNLSGHTGPRSDDVARECGGEREGQRREGGELHSGLLLYNEML